VGICGVDLEAQVGIHLAAFSGGGQGWAGIGKELIVSTTSQTLWQTVLAD
jgi:hypothetical protein